MVGSGVWVDLVVWVWLVFLVVVVMVLEVVEVVLQDVCRPFVVVGWSQCRLHVEVLG
jgi:hypothetical protein